MIEATDDSFKELIGQGDVLVDFWASWCSPCRVMLPVLDQIALDYNGRLKVIKVNIEENVKLAQEYSITSIPTLLLFRNGRKIAQRTGSQSKSQLELFINTSLLEN